MIKAIFKDKTKDISYGKIMHDRVTVLPCTIMNNKIINGVMVALAKITKCGRLEVIKNKVGKVIKSDNDSVTIKFNTTFGYDNKLYALMVTPYNLKMHDRLVIAYKEV